MSHFTLDSFATHLCRTFASRCAPGETARAVSDTDGKGNPILDFTLPNSHDARHSVSLTANTYKGTVSLCTLWFGQVEVTAALDPEDAVAAIEEIIAGHLVAVARYKNHNAYEARRRAGSGKSQWLFQLPDDAGALSAMTERLSRPAGLGERISGRMTGVFEVFRWESSEIFER